MQRLFATGALLLASASVFAQTPYAGMQTRAIKALSEQQVSDLNAGHGMGLALAAELNGYPGPSHVLELADKLELSSDQRTRVQSLFDAMKAEAVPLGAKLLDQEAALDQQFANHSITPETLKARDGADRCDTSRTAEYASQISPADDANTDARTNAAICRAQRVRLIYPNAPAPHAMK